MSKYVEVGATLREIADAEHCSRARAFTLLKTYGLHSAWQHTSRKRRMRRRLMTAIMERTVRFRPGDLLGPFVRAAERRGLEVTAPPRSRYVVLLEGRKFHLHRASREHKSSRTPNGKSRTYYCATLCANVLHVICFPTGEYYFVLPTSGIMRTSPLRNGRRHAVLYFPMNKPLPEENWPNAQLIRAACPEPKGASASA
jgi:hypothetical protein